MQKTNTRASITPIIYTSLIFQIVHKSIGPLFCTFNCIAGKRDSKIRGVQHHEYVDDTQWRRCAYPSRNQTFHQTLEHWSTDDWSECGASQTRNGAGDCKPRTRDQCAPRRQGMAQVIAATNARSIIETYLSDSELRKNKKKNMATVNIVKY